MFRLFSACVSMITWVNRGRKRDEKEHLAGGGDSARVNLNNARIFMVKNKTIYLGILTSLIWPISKRISFECSFEDIPYFCLSSGNNFCNLLRQQRCVPLLHFYSFYHFFSPFHSFIPVFHYLLLLYFFTAFYSFYLLAFLLLFFTPLLLFLQLYSFFTPCLPVF